MVPVTTEDRHPLVSVIIPVYNEAPNIRPLLEELQDALRDEDRGYEILFIDDASTDGSTELLRSIEDPAVRVLRHHQNAGQGAAIRTGFEEAEGQFLVTLDADRQFDPADIPRFIEALEDGNDVVCGWRTNRGDIDPFSKTVPSRVFNWLARRSTGEDLHDLAGGMRGLRREVLDQVPMYGDLHRFLPIMAAKFGFRVTEVPIEIRERQAGKTKYGTRRLWSGVMDLIKVLFLTTYHLRPFHVFGTVGMLLMLIGFSTGSYLVIKKFALGISLFEQHGPLLILVSLAFTSGLNLLFMGLLGEMVSSLRGQDRKDTAHQEL